MREKLRGKEKMANEAEAFPLVDSLLGRLNDFDLRLRQLEEKPMLSERHFAADLRSRRKQRASCNDGDHLKGVLMDRLNLLDNRIRQIGRELDRGAGAGGGEEITADGSRTENRQLVLSSGVREEASGPWRAGADIFQTRVSNKKSRDSMPAATTEAAEKRAAAFCRKERRRIERIRLYRRWFPVGC